MKKYKLFAVMLVVTTLITSLSGCIIIPISKYYDISAEDVLSVQFYDLRNDKDAQLPGFDKIYDPVFTLPEDSNEAFLEAFSELRFSDTLVFVIAAIDSSFSYGDWVIRINFSDGSYTFYSCGGYGETYDADGKYITSTHLSCEIDELEELIGSFYEIK